MVFYIFLALTILWFVFMTYLSHQDGEHTRRTSQELAEKLSFLNVDAGVLNGKLRRIAHVIVFAVLMVLLGMTLQAGEMQIGKLPVWIMAFPVIWSYADEATKPLIQGRHFSWFDVGLNLLGTVIGGLVIAMIVWFL